METTINGRINQVMENERMNINTFSKSLNKSYTAVEAVVKGKSKPGYDFLEAIFIQYKHINPTWLLTGEGEMLKPTAPAMSADSYLSDHLKALEENFSRLASQLESKDKHLEGLLSQKDSVIESLKSVIEYQRQLLSTKEKSFLNGTPYEGRIIPFMPVKNEKATA